MIKTYRRARGLSPAIAVSFAALCLPIAALCLSSCDALAGGAGTVTAPGTKDATNREILAGLGLKLDESAAKTGKGEAVSGDMNPLGPKVKRFFARYELSQVGATVAGHRYDLFDRGNNGDLSRMAAYSPAETGSEAGWLDKPKKSAAGDIDGDGRDEILTAAFDGPNKTISLKCASPDGTLRSVNLTNQAYMDDFGARTWLFDDFFMRDLTAGDFDNDGRAEFALSCMDKVLILESDLSVAGSFTLPDMGSNPIVRVEAGDLNGDDCADLVVVYGKNYNDPNKLCKYMIFKGGAGGLGIGVEDTSPLPAAGDTVQGQSGIQFCSGEVAIADYNGDGLNELVFAGLRWDDGRVEDSWAGGGAYMHLYALVWDPFDEAQGSWRRTFPKTAEHDFGRQDNDSTCVHPLNFYVPAVAAGDFDGDGKDGFLVGDRLFEVNASGEIKMAADQPFNGHDPDYFHGLIYDLAVAGDVTGDGRDDLVYMTHDVTPGWLGTGWSRPRQNRVNKLAVWGRNSSAVFGELHAYSLDSSDQHPTLALADADGDSLTVEYERHELAFSKPKILAVLASPPYWPEIMDLGNSATSYSTSTQAETTNQGHMGFYVGGSIGVGYEWNDAFGSGAGAELNIKATAESDFSWSWGTTTGYGTECTYSVNAGYDQVLFTGMPIDVYIYKVLAGPKAFVDANGPALTVSVPRQPRTSSLELGAYNASVKEEDRIPASIINHRIGNPYSYYSNADMAKLKAANPGWLFSEGTAVVTQNSGNSEINTWSSVVKTNGFDFDLKLGATVEGKAAYVVFDVSAGIRGGYSYEFSQGGETKVGGVVGCIPKLEDWSAKKFDWGLMMIPKTYGDQRFSFVTYWVE